MSVARSVLRTRLKNYGFAYLADATLNSWLDEEAAHTVVAAQWPSRRAFAVTAGVAGSVAVAFLGPVRQVKVWTGTIPERVLRPMSYDDAVERAAQDADTGPPEWWYRWPGQDVIGVFPTQAVDFSVDHFSRRVWATGGLAAASDADTLLLADQWVSLVVHRALARCHEENGDFQAATHFRTLFDNELAEAIDDLRGEDPDEASFIEQVVTDGY